VRITALVLNFLIAVGYVWTETKSRTTWERTLVESFELKVTTDDAN